MSMISKVPGEGTVFPWHLWCVRLTAFTHRIHMVNCSAGEAVGYGGLPRLYFYQAIVSTIPLGQLCVS